MKYRDIPVSRYFLIRYIIIGHFFNTAYRYYADEQPVLATPPVKNWRILLEQSF